MWRLYISLLSGIIVGAGCARQAAERFRESGLFTSDGVPRHKLLGLRADTVPHIEKVSPYYRDELGYAYRFAEEADSLAIWVEYYIGNRDAIRAMSITYESPTFRVLTRRYQSWRGFLRGSYGAGQGHLGHEIWQTPGGGRVRLMLSPDRHYLQVTFSTEK